MIQVEGDSNLLVNNRLVTITPGEHIFIESTKTSLTIGYDHGLKSLDDFWWIDKQRLLMKDLTSKSPFLRIVRDEDETKGTIHFEIDYENYYKIHTAEKSWPKSMPRNIKAGENVLLHINTDGDIVVSQKVKKVAVPMTPTGYPLQYFDDNNILRDWKIVRDFEEEDVKPLVIDKNMTLKVQPYMKVEELPQEVIISRSDLDEYYTLRKLLRLE